MAHEELTREQDIEGSSDRSFGLVIAAAFVVIAAFPLSRGADPRWWAIAIAALFAGIATLRPVLLAGLNLQWTRLGLLLGRVVGPLALGLLFFGVLTPLSALMRLSGRDLLHLKRDREASTYWVRRDPPGPPPQSMTQQF